MNLSNKNPLKTQAWINLKEHCKLIKKQNIKDLFIYDSNRFKKFHIIFNDILFDYSKNRINQNTIKLLLELAQEYKIKEAINLQFKGLKINRTENRSVLHVALRDKSKSSLIVNGENIMKKINQTLNKIKILSKKIISGSWKGVTGCSITDIVNIGIGGSHLGPFMTCEALKFYKNHLKLHFISNIDGTNINEILTKINIETTLFIISSKTFTTQETITNAYTVKKWFLKYSTHKDMNKHFIGVSSNKKALLEFGIESNNIFEIWDWVGGRYSIWSAVGLPLVLSIGFDKFNDFLEGAYEMDLHFQTKPLSHNIPVLLALLGIWYNNFFSSESIAILPYEEYLAQLPLYLQQVDMESNGKNIDRTGNKVNYSTGQIVWGGVGTNAQHAFYQLIHQGTRLIPCDLFVGANSLHPLLHDHHDKLLSNYFAQSQALAFGKSKKDVVLELKKEGFSNSEIMFLSPFKTFSGNIPSNSFLYKKLTPKVLGSIIAMYEHKIYIQGIIWNIFSYDQWGVELGKELSNKILFKLQNKNFIDYEDSSTRGLINTLKMMKD